jgi:putative ABC transport system permease protein
MDAFWRDLRYGLRGLLRTRRLTGAALLCTALGIGSAVFMFTLVEAVLLRRPPFPAAGRLVRVRLLTAEGSGQGDLSYPEFQELRSQQRAFDALEMVARTRMAVVGGDGAERVRGEAVTPGYFDLLGIKPARGRLFSPEEYAPGGNGVILIGDALWKRSFGGDPGIVGKTLRVRGRQGANQVYVVAGVMPPGFAGTVDYDVSELWLPLEHAPMRRMLAAREARIIWPTARLAPGVSVAAAQAEIEQIGRRMAGAHPALYAGYRLRVEPFGESFRAPLRSGLLMLGVAAGLLLAIACTNVASLLLARLAERRHELTLRFVLGARRAWVLRQLLLESLLLSVAGGIAGSLLALWAIRLFAASRSMSLPWYVVLAPDPRVLALAVGLVVGTGVVFGALPACFGARLDASQQLREAGRGATAGRRQRSYLQALVVLEVTFTFVLVVGATLMLRTYLNLVGGPVGFRTDHLLRLAITLDSADFPRRESWIDFAAREREALRRYPGVRDVAVMSGVLPPHDDDAYDVALDGVPNDALKAVPRHAVDPHFLRVLGIELTAGRNLEDADRQATPPVALVSQSLASFIARGARGAPGKAGAVLGKSLQLIDGETRALSPRIAIVGVVKDVLYRGPRPIAGRLGNRYEIYVPLAQAPGPTLSTAVETAGDPAALSLGLQRELGRLAPSSPLHWISTMEEELGSEYTDSRFYALLTGGYSLCALLLAALGIYGMLANSVDRRRGDLGIRMAAGARGSDVVRLVVGEGMRLLLAGLLLGAAIAAAGARLLAGLLYGVAAVDPLSFAAVALVLGLCGLAACYLPARRASRVDPAAVLRGQ